MKICSCSVALLVLGTQLSLLGALNIEPVVDIEKLGGNASHFLPVTTVNCRIMDVNGTLTARWRHDNDTFTEASSGKYVVTITTLGPNFNVTTLTINPLVYTDSGVYICEAMDDSTSWVNATTELILRTHLNASESSVTVYSNVTSIRLSCDMAGFVPPISDLQWFRNGVMLQNTSDYTILNEGGSRAALLPGSTQIGSSVLTVLMISEPQVEDSGEYQCRIVSLDMSESVQLTVLTTSSSLSTTVEPTLAIETIDPTTTIGLTTINFTTTIDFTTTTTTTFNSIVLSTTQDIIRNISFQLPSTTELEIKLTETSVPQHTIDLTTTTTKTVNSTIVLSTTQDIITSQLPSTTELSTSTETSVPLHIATSENNDELPMTNTIDDGSGLDSTLVEITQELTSEFIELSTQSTGTSLPITTKSTQYQQTTSSHTSFIEVSSTAPVSSVATHMPAPSNATDEVNLVIIFTAVVMFMVLLIGLAVILLVFLCFGQKGARKHTGVRNSSKLRVKVEELPMNKTNRPKYTAVNKPSPPPIPVHTMAGEMLVFQNVDSDADQPQEILAFDSLRPLPPPPAQVTPRSSIRISTRISCADDNDYSCLEDTATGYYSDYKEPADSIGILALKTSHTSRAGADPYDDTDGGTLEPSPRQIPPPIPFRESSQVSSSSELSSAHDYDHIYREPLEPYMLAKPSIPPRPDQDALPYAPIYVVPKGKAFKAFQISVNNIRLIQELGKGHFGKVYLAATTGVSLNDLKLSSDTDRHRSLLVAVKQLKSKPNCDLTDAFHQQITFMSRLKHANVIRLLAISNEKPPFIVMEYMENGDLHEFLRRQQLKPDSISALNPNEVTPMILFYISVQIASGMHYLASKKFIHRDLATRNCLIGRDFVVKISDFGMSRNAYKSSYYCLTGQLILPIRWMATETLYGKFSTKSDSWAYGVTVWEVFTLCQVVPYSDMSDSEVIQDALKGEGRMLLQKPQACPVKVYEVMKRCFLYQPFMRADFEEIYSRMLTLYTRMSHQNA